MLLLSTSAQFGAIGTNQLCAAAAAVASLPLTAAAWSSSAVAFGSAPLAMSSCWIGVDVKSLIHSAASACFLLLRRHGEVRTTEERRGRLPAASPGSATEATLPLTAAVSTIGELGSFGSLWPATAPRRAPSRCRRAWPSGPGRRSRPGRSRSWSGHPCEYVLAESAHSVRPASACGALERAGPLAVRALGRDRAALAVDARHGGVPVARPACRTRRSSGRSCRAPPAACRRPR